MNNHEKNQLIIQEILKWKENRLLPEEQCDFLLALYTKGGEIEITNKNKNWLSTWKKLHFTMMLMILVSVIFLDYYYQLAGSVGAGILCFVFFINILIWSRNGKNASRRYRYLFISIQLLYVLQLSICIMDTFGLGAYNNFMITANGIGWIVFGYLKKLPVIRYLGAALTIGIITFVVFFKYLG
ncbi:hypothetical protein J18TS1_28820 [Oceanobacillus oncorhynchi subsp. incaldanensis]|uniref:hypothetical protein n=1 Tax=Oceanobacillus TaxID=182709 RepID=UPI001AFFC3D0|nr:hypothetical protein [Oceanobacillus oncorhynchi]GIO19782.1 hypothetical protein J18TS1_28820 [Oceanobacillus oncorhynchi subsp. incaldanensis]